MPFGRMEDQKHNRNFPESGWLVGIATAPKVENLNKRYHIHRSFGTSIYLLSFYIIRKCVWRRGVFSLSYLRRGLVQLLRLGAT